jgi:hypothetical protein
LPQILADENIPASAVEWLKRKGFTAVRVLSTNTRFITVNFKGLKHRE